MICPHCKQEIDSKLIAKELGRIGGHKSRRKLTSEQAREMSYKRKNIKTGQPK